MCFVLNLFDKVHIASQIFVLTFALSYNTAHLATFITIAVSRRLHHLSMSPRKGKTKDEESGDDTYDYRKKRDRNNMAVKKSRVKSKQKTEETMLRVNQLKSENTVLEEKVNQLTKELNFLKELFLAHAGNNADVKYANVDLQKIFGNSSGSDQ